MNDKPVNEIDAIIRDQAMQFAKSIRMASAAEGSFVVLMFDRQSCVAVDPLPTDKTHATKMLRAIVTSAARIVQQSTGGRCSLMIKFSDDNPIDALEYFSAEYVDASQL